MNKKLIIIFSIFAIIFVGRIIPHPYNFTPLIGMTLLSGFLFKNRLLAMIIPLLSFWLSDIFINNYIYSGYYNGFTIFQSGMFWTYGSVLAISLIGSKFLSSSKISKVCLASLSGSTIFFIISNLGVWFSSAMYAKSLAGLIQCYTLALPFYGSSLIGDLIYSSIFFSAYNLATSQNLFIASAKQQI